MTPPPAQHLRPTLPKRSGDLKRTLLAVAVLGLVFAVGAFLTWDWRTAQPKEPTPTPPAPPPRLSRPSQQMPWEYTPQLPLDPPKAEAAPVRQAPPSDALADEIRKLVISQQGIQGQLELLTKALQSQQQRSVAPTNPSPPPAAAPQPKETAEARKRRLKEDEREREERDNKKKQWKGLHLALPQSKNEPSSRIKSLTTPYAVAPGWLIPCQTEMALSNESPGPFRAFVTQPVMDTATGQHVVIPQGSILVGKASGQTIFGDNRIAVEFSSLTFPNGDYVELKQAVGSGQTGTSGFTDQVDRHYLRLLGSVLITGVLRGGTSIVAGGFGYGADRDPAQAITGAIATETATRGTQEARQFLRTEPTITIRPGYGCNILLQTPLELPHAYQG